MPYVSVIVPTMRVGGIDLLLESLARQEFTDFELVLVDAIKSRRAGKVAEYARDKFLRVVHVEPEPNRFPVAQFCAQSNAGLRAASGEVALFAVDYSIFPPNWVKAHAEFHRADPTKRGGLMGPHRYIKFDASPILDYGRSDVAKYQADLAMKRLDLLLLNSGTVYPDTPAAPFEVDEGNMAIPDADPKLRLPGGVLAPQFFHAKNESVRIERVAEANGWDEDLDGGHGYQDTDFAERLTIYAGVVWGLRPDLVVKIASPRHAFPFAARERTFAEQRDLWMKKRQGGYKEVRGIIKTAPTDLLALTIDPSIRSFPGYGSCGIPASPQDIEKWRASQLASKCMRIAMVYGQFSSAIHGPFDLEGLYTRVGLTGSESSFFNLARSLAERGHDVAAFCDCVAPYTHPSGLEILPIHSLPALGQVQNLNAMIAWNEPDYFQYAPASAVRIVDQQLNDWGYCRVPDWGKMVDMIVFPSESSRRHHVRDEDLKIPDGASEIIPNSVDLDLFAGEAPARAPHRVVYCSSPDRGLHHLLAMWPLVRRRVLDAELKIFYRLAPWLAGARDTSDEVGRRARYVEDVIPRLARMGVEVVGPVPNARMARELQAAAILAYPCDPVRYTEGFGCSVLDACAAGCFPIISDADALAEVHGRAARVIEGKTDEQQDAWVGAIVDALFDGSTNREMGYNYVKMMAHAEAHSRDKIADRWELLLSRAVR